MLALVGPYQLVIYYSEATENIFLTFSFTSKVSWYSKFKTLPMFSNSRLPRNENSPPFTSLACYTFQKALTVLKSVVCDVTKDTLVSDDTTSQVFVPPSEIAMHLVAFVPFKG